MGGRYSTMFSRLVTGVLLLVPAGTCMAQSRSLENDLIGSAWVAEDIGGHGVIDHARTTLEFAGEGRVAGRGACNRYMGPVSFDGDSVTFGNLAATMMACPQAMMDQEQRFFAVIGEVDTLELTQGGQVLVGYTNGVPAVRFSRIVEK